jgi:RNA polymerase sigma-70 factor (ECF subfamily)
VDATVIGMLGQRKPRPLLSVVPPAKGAATAAARLSDDELLAGLRRGDPAVAADFYWRVRPIVARTVRRLLGRLDQDGGDLVQIALIQLIEAIPRYRGECPLDGWVSAISANVIYKHIRRRRLERSLFVGNPVEGEDSLGLGQVSMPGPVIEARQLAGRIGEHLSAMNPDRAWAYLLHDVGGYSLEEIAHIAGISTAAAQSRLSRGRRELHQRIAADASLVELAKKAGDRG